MFFLSFTLLAVNLFCRNSTTVYFDRFGNSLNWANYQLNVNTLYFITFGSRLWRDHGKSYLFYIPCTRTEKNFVFTITKINRISVYHLSDIISSSTCVHAIIVGTNILILLLSCSSKTNAHIVLKFNVCFRFQEFLTFLWVTMR